MEVIRSKENKLFKFIKKLKKKKYRDLEKLFIGEGKKLYIDTLNIRYIILKEGVKLGEISFIKDEEYSKVIYLGESLFRELSDQMETQGVVFIYEKPLCNLPSDNKDIVILDEVQDPGNLGTIIRTVDACGIKNIILTKGSVDPYSQKVIRSTMGSIGRVHLHIMEKKDLIYFLKENNYYTIATALLDESISYLDMSKVNKRAFIFGNEGHGISKELLEISDEKVIIPIIGGAESLNVSIASGVILFKSIEGK